MDFRDRSRANGDSLARHAAYVKEQLSRVVGNVFGAPKALCSLFSNTVGDLAEVLRVLKDLQERVNFPAAGGVAAAAAAVGAAMCAASGARVASFDGNT